MNEKNWKLRGTHRERVQEKRNHISPIPMDRLIHWTNSLCGLSFCQIVNGSTMRACVQCACLCWYETFWWNWMHTNNPNRTDDFTKWREEKSKWKIRKTGAMHCCKCVHTAIEMQVRLQKHNIICEHSWQQHITVSLTWVCVSVCYALISYNAVWDVKVQWTHIRVCNHRYTELIDTGQTILEHTRTNIHTYESVNQKICLDRLVQKATTILSTEQTEDEREREKRVAAPATWKVQNFANSRKHIIRP